LRHLQQPANVARSPAKGQTQDSNHLCKSATQNVRVDFINKHHQSSSIIINHHQKTRHQFNQHQINHHQLSATTINNII
jgi:hypothetical protein